MAQAGSRRGKIGSALMLIGVIALGFGAYNLRALTWDTETGSVDSCVTRSTRSSNKSGSSQYTSHQDCTVTWTAGGTKHQAKVTFDGGKDLSRTEQKISVKGGTVVAYADRYTGLLYAGGGALMIVIGLVLWSRRPRL
ncbi:hypothetical protein F4553_007795 [Allocatelliglobosispora scoriae]|uniref:DUF3592 domain-containing protein n=1 Tax=Allocatelliglobosispora scoriae TaxID=643052 RepID=A0A841C6E9_9ACTN|nr:hypothetical protein [Allocatelliglobosispora scoriae]MBB5874361.1 hypothetical protein [Allocatelliglobosispora scoriae]